MELTDEVLPELLREIIGEQEKEKLEESERQAPSR